MRFVLNYLALTGVFGAGVLFGAWWAVGRGNV